MKWDFTNAPHISQATRTSTNNTHQRHIQSLSALPTKTIAWLEVQSEVVCRWCVVLVDVRVARVIVSHSYNLTLSIFLIFSHSFPVPTHSRSHTLTITPRTLYHSPTLSLPIALSLTLYIAPAHSTPATPTIRTFSTLDPHHTVHTHFVHTHSHTSPPTCASYPRVANRSCYLSSSSPSLAAMERALWWRSNPLITWRVGFGQQGSLVLLCSTSGVVCATGGIVANEHHFRALAYCGVLLLS